MEQIPIFDLKLNELSENSGVRYISFVKRPATGAAWITLSKEEVAFIRLGEEEERRVFGPLMIPNQLILRKDAEGKPFYVRFDEDTIIQTRNRFMSMGNGRAANSEHVENMMMEGVYLTDSFMSGGKLGLQPPAQFKGLPENTWFGGFNIENDTVWTDFVKTGLFTGMSIDGFYSPHYSGDTADMNMHQQFSEEEILNGIIEVSQELIALQNLIQ